MDNPREAVRSLERIRVLMERAGRFSHLTATSAFVAGLLALGGALLSYRLGADFNSSSDSRILGWIWGTVFLLAFAQALGLSIASARRRGDEFWGPLTQQVALAMLPAFFIGLTVTAYGLRRGELEILPPFWTLAYGASLMALGLYAGGRIQGVGLLFLLAGAASLLVFKNHGRLTMLFAFGGGHILLGLLIAWKPRSSAV